MASLLLAALLPAVDAQAQIVSPIPINIILEKQVTTPAGVTAYKIRKPSINNLGEVLVYLEATVVSSGGANGYFTFGPTGWRSIAREFSFIDIGGQTFPVGDPGGALDAREALASDGSFAFWASDNYYLWRDGVYSTLAVAGQPDSLGNTFTGLQYPGWMASTGFIGLQGPDLFWVLDGSGSIEAIPGFTGLGVTDSGAAVGFMLGDLFRHSAGATSPVIRIGDALPGGEVDSVNAVTVSPTDDVYVTLVLRPTPAADCTVFGECTSQVFRFPVSGPPEHVFNDETSLAGTGGLTFGMDRKWVGPSGRVGVSGFLRDPANANAYAGSAAAVIDGAAVTLITKSGDAVPGLPGYFVSSDIMRVQPAGADRVFLEVGVSTDPAGGVPGADVLLVYEGGSVAPIMMEGSPVTFADGSTRTLSSRAGVVFTATRNAGEAINANIGGQIALKLYTEEAGATLVIVGGSLPFAKGADLEASGSVAISGTLHVYEVTVTNHGPDPVDDYVLTLSLPTGFVSAAAAPPGCLGQESGNPISTFVCSEDLVIGPALGVGESKTWQTTVTAPDQADYSAELTVSWSGNDPDGSNDSLQIVGDGTRGMADLSVNMKETRGDVEIKVSNAGPDDAMGVVLQLSMGFESAVFDVVGDLTCTASASAQADTRDAVCALAPLPAGETVVLIWLGASGNARATVSADQSDPNLADNSDLLKLGGRGCESAPSGTAVSAWFAVLFLLLSLSRRGREGLAARSRAPRGSGG